jgi:transposase
VSDASGTRKSTSCTISSLLVPSHLACTRATVAGGSNSSIVGYPDVIPARRTGPAVAPECPHGINIGMRCTRDLTDEQWKTLDPLIPKSRRRPDGRGRPWKSRRSRNGLPVSVCAESATPHEVTLAVSTLLQMVVPDAPQNLVGDNAYDSDRLDAELKFYGIEVIAPHRRNRRNSTQDGRRLRRYRRRWKIERLFAWLQNFRRLVIRYERHAENFLGMLQLASSLKYRIPCIDNVHFVNKTQPPICCGLINPSCAPAPG